MHPALLVDGRPDTRAVAAENRPEICEPRIGAVAFDQFGDAPGRGARTGNTRCPASAASPSVTALLLLTPNTKNGPDTTDAGP